jgi:tripartite-type tricarboxylate transporter receptor subunit TctC
MIIRTLATLTLGILSIANANAQSEYPNKPIILVVPQAVGGANDAVARVFAPKLAEALKTSVIIENRVGAGGNLGTAAVARAPKDGYTLMLTVGSAHTVNPALYGSKTGFDPVADFAPITIVATAPYVLVTNAKFPPKNVKELLETIRAKPGQYNYASAGNGTLNHLFGEMLKQSAGLYMVHIPYRGAAAAAIDVVAGQIPLTFGSLPGVMPFVKSGQLNLLAAATPTRSALIPDTPTIGETIKGFGAVSWYGLFAPSGTPKAVLDKVAETAQRVLTAKDVQDRLMLQGAEAVTGVSSQQFATTIKTDLAQWAKVVKDSKAQID